MKVSTYLYIGNKTCNFRGTSFTIIGNKLSFAVLGKLITFWGGKNFIPFFFLIIVLKF